MTRISEKKRMAIINLTCDFPGKYCAMELSGWAEISPSAALNLCNILSLDVVKGNSRMGSRAKRYITGYRDYFKKEYGNRDNNNHI